MKNRRVTIAEKFNDVASVMKIAEGCKFPEELYIFQKDSKTITVLNVPSRKLTHRTVDFRGNFPHNF